MFCLGPDFLESQSGLERQVFILLTNVYLNFLQISVQKQITQLNCNVYCIIHDHDY